MSRDSNVLPISGNKDSMNLNSLVLSNIMGSQYFKVSLYEKKAFLEVVDEIYYRVSRKQRLSLIDADFYCSGETFGTMGERKSQDIRPYWHVWRSK